MKDVIDAHLSIHVDRLLVRSFWPRAPMTVAVGVSCGDDGMTHAGRCWSGDIQPMIHSGFKDETLRIG